MKEVQTFKFWTINRFSTCTVPVREISTLNHELYVCGVWVGVWPGRGVGGGNVERLRIYWEPKKKGEITRTFGMTLWKGLPAYPNPCCPVASSRKLRAVFGTLSSNSWKTIRPDGFESIAMSNFYFWKKVCCAWIEVLLRIKKKKLFLKRTNDR